MEKEKNFDNWLKNVIHDVVEDNKPDPQVKEDMLKSILQKVSDKN